MAKNRPTLRDLEARLWESVDVVPREHFVTLASGPKLRVQETGEGPPVIFVHGATNAGTSWHSLMADMPGFRCIAIDRPGCGLSTPAEGLAGGGVEAFRGYADDLIVEVMDAMDLPTASIVVTSMGGYFGIRAAATHPDRIEKAVFLSWLMGAPMERVTVLLRFGALPGLGKMMAKVPPTRGAVKMMLKEIGLKRAIQTGTFSSDMIDWFAAVLKETDTMANELVSVPQLIRPIAGQNEEVLHSDEVLARVTSPTLFLWGEEDPNGARVVAESFVARLPNGTLEMIPEAGHAPWIDEPALVASRTIEFLAS